MTFRFTLIHDVLGSLEISEPGGWRDHKLTMNRHMDFFTLVESLEAELLFYGNNGTENGGIEFIDQVVSTYGFDAELRFFVELDANDTGDYVDYFDGILPLHAMERYKDNRAIITPLQSTLWTKFLNRLETPVDVQSTTTLDGNPCDPTPPITVKLTSQVVRGQYEATSSTPGVTDEDVNVIVAGTYYAMSWNKIELEEFREISIPPQVDDVEIPIPVIVLEYGGEYSFNIQTVAYDYAPGAGGYNFGVGEDLSDYIRFYININGVETEFTVGDKFDSDNTDGGRFYSLNLTNQILPAGSLIQVYGKAIASLTATPSFNGQIRWNGPIVGNISINSGALEDVSIDASAQITADTIFPESEAEGFLIHDLLYGVLDRILN